MVYRSCFKRAIFIAAFLLAGLSLSGADKDFVLVRNGQAQAVIVENPQVREAQQFLIREAAKCGVKLDQTKAAASGNKIVFEVKDMPMDREDSFTIDFPDRQTMRISCSPVSARWAVNHLLETAFGVRWIFPHLKQYGKEDINDYPKAEDIAVKAEKFVQKPYSLFINRGMGWRFSTPWNLNLGHKLNMNNPHWLVLDVFPVWKYAADQSWPDEIMPIRKGKKIKLPPPKKLPLPKNPYLAKRWGKPNTLGVNYDNFWNPCFSNPKTAEIAIINILETLAKNPKQKVISMSPNDNGGFCECEACRKTIGNKRNFSGFPDYSIPYWTWVNKVAEAVSARHNDVWFAASAYRETTNPPPFQLHPKIVVKFAFELNGMHDPQTRKIRLEQMKTWSARCTNLATTNYDYGKGFYLLPRVSFKLHSEMLKKFYQAYNLRGMYTEAMFLPFDGPKFHMMYRLMRDIDADPEEIIETWCRDAVGLEATPALRKYFQFWEDYWSGPDIRRTQWFRSKRNVYLQLGERATHTFALKRGDMKKLRVLMEEVVAKAGTSQQKRRAKVLMTYFEYAEAAAQGLFSELIPPEGQLSSAADAVELLKQVPAALDAEKRFRNNPYNKINRFNTEDSILSTLLMNVGLVLPFIKDPSVRAELVKLENDSRLPAILRAQIKIWLGFKAKNLIENGSFEQEEPMIRPMWTKKLSGRRDTRHASDGKYSFRTANGTYCLTPKIERGKNYLFLCDVFIEQGSNEGRFSYRLGPSMGTRPRSWHKKVIVPSGGIWNTYSAVVSSPHPVDNLHIRLSFQKFEKHEPVWFDNLRLYCLDDFDLKDTAKQQK